tara:strand:+ start:387 stop:545 length:159 start_codon:yes stop_codon:yes gene_type:complete
MDVNTQRWEERYQVQRGIARYPYEEIVSKVFNLSSGKEKKDLSAFDFGYGGG